MAPDAGYRAVREGVAWSQPEHVVHLRVSGAGAFALLDRVCPAELFLRDGQLIQTLLLDEKGHAFADLYVGRDDDDFLLAVEGPDAAALQAWLRTYAGPDVQLDSLDEGHATIALHGPYAWELLADLVGPQVVGLPYGNLFRVEGWLCTRAGKTGEYGYELLVPRAHSADFITRLVEKGRRYELAQTDLATLDQCALENWFFNIRREGAVDVTPIELQLQWRLSRRKQFVGHEALATRRAAGIKQRLTYLVGAGPIAVGDVVSRDGVPVGTVTNCGRCEARGEWVALALLDVAWAHVGLDGFAVPTTALRSITPPGIDNRSLFVNPQRHSYFTRSDDTFPPLVSR